MTRALKSHYPLGDVGCGGGTLDTNYLCITAKSYQDINLTGKQRSTFAYRL